MEKEIYVIEEVVGDYEDRWSSPHLAYSNYEEAEKECERLNDYYNKVYDTFLDGNEEFGSPDVIEAEIFNNNLKEVNPDLYEQVVKAGKEADDKFDWEKYYRLLDEFIYDYDTVIEIAKSQGLSKKKIEFLEVDHELENFNHDKPYYYVSKHPVKLID